MTVVCDPCYVNTIYGNTIYNIIIQYTQYKTSCVWPWYVIRVMGASADPVCATRERWDITRKPIPLTYLSNFFFERFHTIIGSSCASPNFMWWWCLKFVRKCSQYKFCNGWVDPSLDHWEYFGISTTFVKSIIIVITFFVFCSIHAYRICTSRTW